MRLRRKSLPRSVRDSCIPRLFTRLASPLLLALVLILVSRHLDVPVALIRTALAPEPESQTSPIGQAGTSRIRVQHAVVPADRLRVLAAIDLDLLLVDLQLHPALVEIVLVHGDGEQDVFRRGRQGHAQRRGLRRRLQGGQQICFDGGEGPLGAAVEQDRVLLVLEAERPVA